MPCALYIRIICIHVSLIRLSETKCLAVGSSCWTRFGKWIKLLLTNIHHHCHWTNDTFSNKRLGSSLLRVAKRSLIHFGWSVTENRFITLCGRLDNAHLH
jgi:hypothetical protein